MKENIFMRVLLCKIQCPFICFCKPSAAAHLYTCGPLKLENTSHPQGVPCRVVSVSDSLDQPIAEVKEEGISIGGKDNADNVLKSCIKKVPTTVTVTGATEAIRETEKKKRVQWVDSMGKELAEIKEFESSESGENEFEEENRSGCVCIIL